MGERETGIERGGEERERQANTIVEANIFYMRVIMTCSSKLADILCNS